MATSPSQPLFLFFQTFSAFLQEKKTFANFCHWCQGANWTGPVAESDPIDILIKF